MNRLPRSSSYYQMSNNKDLFDTWTKRARRSKDTIKTVEVLGKQKNVHNTFSTNTVMDRIIYTWTVYSCIQLHFLYIDVFVYDSFSLFGCIWTFTCPESLAFNALMRVCSGFLLFRLIPLRVPWCSISASAASALIKRDQKLQWFMSFTWVS